MNDSSKITGALLIGAAAGAALGLLFAPSTGTETRKQISSRANDLVDELKHKIEEGKNIISDITDKIISTSEEYTKKASNTASNVSSAASANRPMHV